MINVLVEAVEAMRVEPRKGVEQRSLDFLGAGLKHAAYRHHGAFGFGMLKNVANHSEERSKRCDVMVIDAEAKFFYDNRIEQFVPRSSPANDETAVLGGFLLKLS